MNGQKKEEPPATVSGAGELRIPGLSEKRTMVIPPKRQKEGFTAWLEQQRNSGVTITTAPDGTVTIEMTSKK